MASSSESESEVPPPPVPPLPLPPPPPPEPASDLDGQMERLDAVLDRAFDPLRGRPRVDRAAAGVSNLADYGIVWILLALLKGRRSGPGRRRAVVALSTAGFSSLFLSRALKSLVERQRPHDHLTASVRAPSTSSFPSGHTLAAFTTAFVLAEGDVQTAAYVGFAGGVAASRVHLRAHHPTDVLGGAAIGSVLGLGLRPLVNAVAPGRKAVRAKTRRVRSRGMRLEGGGLHNL